VRGVSNRIAYQNVGGDMSCPSCGSHNRMEFRGELMVHFNGLKSVDKPGVLLFPELLVCMGCGAMHCKVPTTELALLAESTPTSASDLGVIDATPAN